MILAILVTAITTFFFSEAVGFGIHRLAHSPISGRMFRHHMKHHGRDYPPARFMSEKYLSNLRESFIWFFAPAFILMNTMAWVFLVWPVALTFSFVTIGVSFFNDIVHDSFHVKDHWMTRFRWHGRLRTAHRVHHKNLKKNLGMWLFLYDRILGTYST